MAINRKYKDDSGQEKQDTAFVDVTVWGRLAEIANEYVHKGDPVFIQGRLKTDMWDDKQTGKQRSKLVVVAENLQLLTKPQGPPSLLRCRARAPCPATRI